MRFPQYICLLIAALLATGLRAQGYGLATDVPVHVGGQQLGSAWAGGLTAPQLSTLDLDNDGQLDLVVFDRDGERILPFLNQGTPGAIAFTFAPNYIGQFPTGLREWALFRDFDGDGFMDLFTAIYQTNGVRVYRNTSAALGGSLSFAIYQDTVHTIYPPALDLFSGRSDLPAIDDVDGDGDLDILTFQLGGNRVEWHRNTSVETTGGLAGMEFELQSRCFGHFEEDAFDCVPNIGLIPCGVGQRESTESAETRAGAHAGSTILSLDLDSNGLRDLVIGDIGCTSMYALRNGGTTSIAHFTASELDYPANTTPIEVLLFPAAFHLDFDNDGLLDLLVAPNKYDQVEDIKSIHFYPNTGTNGLPQFTFDRAGVLQDRMIDVGTGSMPMFWDHNGDGLVDLLVGGWGRYDSLVGFHPVLSLYQNVGTAQQPSFSLVSSDYLGLRSSPVFSASTHLRPATGDLDGDGDDDLLLGNADGTIAQFTNTAATGQAATFVLQTTNFAAIDAGLNSTPQLVDLDGDADLDLLVGNHRGYVQYYRNDGSVTVPQFGLVTDSLGHVKVNGLGGAPSSNGYAAPFACDYDDDGDLDLLVGGFLGEVQVYENISLVPNAVFARGNDLINFDFGTYACPAAAVLDSARMSFVVGDHRGGLSLVRMQGPTEATPAAQAATRLQLYPQPAGDWIGYAYDGPASAFDSFIFWDCWGRAVMTGEVHASSGTISVGNLPAGWYALAFHGRSGTTSRKVLIQR